MGFQAYSNSNFVTIHSVTEYIRGHMDIKQIEYFCSVVGSGSFSLAAEELFISQSSLSKQMIALEEELGVKLFDRSKRRIALTEAGKMFHKHALGFQKINQALRTDLREYKMAIPSLTIAAIPVTAQYGITSHVAQFKQAYPQINFTLEERQASTILPALSQHKYDLAFIRDYKIDRKGFSSLPVAADQLIVAVSCEHRLAKRNSVSLAELSDENFIMFNKGTLIYELSISSCNSAGFEPRIFYTASRAASIIDMVSSNSGIALIMEKVLNYYNRSEVVALSLEQTIESKVILAYPKNKKPSKPARTFLDFMEKQIGP